MSDVAELKRMGLNTFSLGQIAQAGPGAGLAEAIVSRGPEAVRQLNAVQRQLAKATGGLAATLEASLADLDAAMARLADAMAASTGERP